MREKHRIKAARKGLPLVIMLYFIIIGIIAFAVYLAKTQNNSNQKQFNDSKSKMDSVETDTVLFDSLPSTLLKIIPDKDSIFISIENDSIFESIFLLKLYNNRNYILVVPIKEIKTFKSAVELD